MILGPQDLIPFVDNIDPLKAEAMIEDAEAMASLAAPCISDVLFQGDTVLMGALKAILRGAVLRWHEVGTGAWQQQTAGSFSATTDTRQQRRGMFWPSEIEQLRGLCARFNNTAASAGAFSFTPSRSASGSHAPWCALAFAAAYCSCGADIAGYPIFEQP